MIIYNGASGGLGRYLAPALGLARAPAHILQARLEDTSGLRAELESVRPAGPVTYLHLAALVSVPASEARPDVAYEINVASARAATNAVVDWAQDHRIELRVLYISTGHVYAAAPPGRRLNEDDTTAPRSVYARTKLEAEASLSAVTSERGIPFLIARVFGLLAPRQDRHYVLPALIERVRTGNVSDIPGLDFTRDYLDARDVCSDLLMLAATTWPARPTAVNVCSGEPVTIRELLGVVIDFMRPRRVKAIVRDISSAPGRADDVPWIVGNPGRFCELTGGVPQRVSLARSVADAVALAQARND